MKRTKNMIYNKTDEARELYLYAINNSRLYPMIQSVIKTLQRKYKKGIYDNERAIDSYYHVATEASNLYNKDFGYKFNVSDRFTAATDMEKYFLENVEEVE